MSVVAKYLLLANAIVWLGMGGYIFFLAGRQKRLDTRLKQLELLDNDSQKES